MYLVKILTQIFFYSETDLGNKSVLFKSTASEENRSQTKFNTIFKCLPRDLKINSVFVRLSLLMCFIYGRVGP